MNVDCATTDQGPVLRAIEDTVMKRTVSLPRMSPDPLGERPRLVTLKRAPWKVHMVFFEAEGGTKQPSRGKQTDSCERRYLSYIWKTG